MTVVGDSFTTGPLYDIRTTIAGQITAILGDTVTVYTEWASPSGPSVILDGGGWTQLTGCGLHYTLKVDCVLGNQSGQANAAVEELARQVYDALRQNEYSVDPVPAPGTLKFGDRDYPACQITITFPLNPEA
jgi:hypothetical protein